MELEKKIQKAFEEEFKRHDLTKNQWGDYLNSETEDAFLDFSIGFKAAYIPIPDLDMVAKAIKDEARLSYVGLLTMQDARHLAQAAIDAIFGKTEAKELEAAVNEFIKRKG